MEAKQPMRNLILFRIIPIYLLLFNISCQRSVTNSVVEKLKVDTIRDYKVITKYNAVHDTLTIENPCDSLGLRDFYYKSNLPQGKIIIRTIKGKIQATINMDSISNVYDSKYKSKYENEVKFYEKIVVKNVIPTWAIITIFFESAIIIGFIVYKLSKLSHFFI